MKEGETIDNCIGFIKPMDLRKTPRGVDLISVRQADEFRTAGGSAGVKECADGVGIRVERKIKDFTLGRQRRVKPDHPASGIAFAADYKHAAQRRNACNRRGGFSPNLRIVRFGRYHQHLGVLCNQQIGHGVGRKEVVDGAGDASHLRSEQGDLHLSQRRAEERDWTAFGGYS